MKRWAKWSVSLTFESGGGIDDSSTVNVALKSEWNEQNDQRDVIECVTMDLGSLVRMLQASGHCLEGGDPLSAFEDAMAE